MSFIVTNNIIIGEDTRICDFVNVAGIKFHDSIFKIGERCRIDKGTFIDCGKSIIIDNKYRDC